LLTPLLTLTLQEDQCSIAPMLSILYFCIYMLVCVYILLQLIIGIIVDNIEMAETMDQLSIKQARLGSGWELVLLSVLAVGGALRWWRPWTMARAH